MRRPLYAACPRCGSPFSVLDAVSVGGRVDAATYYAECECGAANLTVEKGAVIKITPREPLDEPECFDEPTPQEYEDYLAQ